MNKCRLIALTDRTGMGGSVIIFKTNAPIEELKELERISNKVYISGSKNGEDVPIWADVLVNKGYIFDYVDEHQHITPCGTSTDWLSEKYPQTKERYIIDDQPFI